MNAKDGAPNATELLAGMLASLQIMQQTQLAMQQTQLELVNIQKRSDERMTHFIEAATASFGMIPPRPVGIHAHSPLTAGKRLVDTFELLEKILLRQDHHDILLRVQLVSKGFRSTVLNSSALRRKLFLKPEYNESAIEINPFLDNPKVFARLPIYYDCTSHSLAFAPGHHGRRYYLDRLRLVNAQSSRHLELELFATQPQPGIDCQPILPGSWKSMFLTQPPCTIKTVVFVVRRRRGRETTERGYRIVLKECTVDGLLEALAECPLTFDL